MQIQKKQSSKSVSLKQDENILVVERSALFQNDCWQGIRKVDTQQFADIILQKKQFLPRSLMEYDPTYKQIIPYLVFKHKESYFLMQRKDKASETRLRSKYSLGIGGHIRQEDMQNDDICAWARREFHEEVSYDGTVQVTQIGILNDDSNDVGKVHVGFVYLLEGNNPHIRVKEELAHGRLISLSGCVKYYESMERWSQFVFDFIRS